jgi:branched-chain amino acid aminotransferase
MHRFILHNDEIHDAADKVLSPGQVGLLAGWGVFSTLRVTSGVLFAWERHWARMQRDAQLLRVPFPNDPDYMHSRLMRLVAANQVSEGTLRVVVVRNRGGIWEGPGARELDLVALTTDRKDWGEGARLAVHPQARHAGSRFSGVKMTSWAQNLTLLEEAQCRGFDEVILLNERDEISECTSANVFVARGGETWTPPLDAGCLPGITREVLLEEVCVEGISIGERALRLEDLEAADEVFITSTTRDLLPVLAVEGRRVHRRGEVRERLQRAFRQYLEEYVARQKHAPEPAANP